VGFDSTRIVNGGGLSMKIIRFLTFADANRVLSDNSTFALSSSLYYRQLGRENNDEIGDKNENYVQFQENRRIYEQGTATLLSCWTELNGTELPINDWTIFSDRKNGIAIVSDAEAVRRLLRDLVREVLGLADEVKYGWHFNEAKVKYYDGISHPPVFETMEAWQWKLDRYENQREYRFALVAGSERMHLQTVVFQVEDPRSYVESIYFGPELRQKDKWQLLSGAKAAMLADRIQDFDDHFSR
jgi:hypothetical protein